MHSSKAHTHTKSWFPRARTTSGGNPRIPCPINNTPVRQAIVRLVTASRVMKARTFKK